MMKYLFRAAAVRRSLLAPLLLTVVLLSDACSRQEESGYNPPAMADRCVVLYMPGRNLDYFYRQNLDGIVRAVSATVPGNGRMLVCWQPDNSRTAVLQEIYYNTRSRQCETLTLKEYGTFAAESSSSVAALLADAVAAAPARQYGLIIGCHGKAWIPASSGALPRSRRAGGAAADVWTPAAGAKPTRSFGDTGHELDITELASVLEALPFRFDYLIFDDCFMASIETLYDLRHAIDYVVASPCEIMAAGFPYDRILPHLFDDEELRPQLGEICREFWNFYQNDWNTISGNEQSGCISLTVMSELEALASEMRRVVEAPKTDFELSELQYYKGGTTKLFYDLGHYVQLSCGDQGTIDTFEAQLERAVPSEYRFHTPSYYSAYNNLLNPITCYTGITTSEPETTEPYASDFRHTSWYLATH